MLALAPALVIAGVWKTHIGGPNWLLDEHHLFGQLIAAALATLLTDLSGLAPAGEPTRHPTFTHRGLATLPVTVT